jgi:ATP synthase protein I
MARARRDHMALIGPEQRTQLRLAGRVSAVGIELVAAILIGYFGGRWLDERFDTAPYLTNSGLVFGIFAGFKALFDLARKVRLDDL